MAVNRAEALVKSSSRWRAFVHRNGRTKTAKPIWPRLPRNIFAWALEEMSQKQHISGEQNMSDIMKLLDELATVSARSMICQEHRLKIVSDLIQYAHGAIWRKC